MVDSALLAGEMEPPILLEVAVGPQSPELEDRFGTRQAPAGSGEVKPIVDDPGLPTARRAANKFPKDVLGSD